jgi:cysteine protease ATG4
MTPDIENLQADQKISGRPSASHYFLGVQDSYLFFLDPHTTRPTTAYRPNEPYTQEELDSYYTTRLRRIHIKDMDPSMLIGFLIKDEDDWIDWKTRIQSSLGKPIVHIFPGQKPDHGEARAEALDEVEVLDDSDGLE